MKLRWLGHAAFRLAFTGGLSFVTDPYSADIGYPPLRVTADYVTKSHDHSDHNNVAAVEGCRRVFDAAGVYHVDGVTVNAVLTPHDDVGGAKRGPNLVFAFDDGDIRVCHLGDLGAPLTDAQRAAIGSVDVLLVPVGGVYTIDARGAATVCEQLMPRLVIPMHYRTASLVYHLAGVDAFLAAIGGGERLPDSELEVTRATLPAKRRVLVLNHG